MSKNIDTIPIEVIILTTDHDIKGTVHVSKYTNTHQDLFMQRLFALMINLHL